MDIVRGLAPTAEVVATAETAEEAIITFIAVIAAAVAVVQIMGLVSVRLAWETAAVKSPHARVKVVRRIDSIVAFMILTTMPHMNAHSNWR